MYNIYSVNKVLLQQILETIEPITKKTLDRNPQQIMKLKPMILELYRHLTHFLLTWNQRKYKDWTNLCVSKSSTISN